MFKKIKKEQNDIKRNVHNNPQRANVFSYRANRSREEESIGRHQQLNDSIKTNQWFYRIPTVISCGVILISFLFATTLNTTPLIKLTPSKENILQQKNTYIEAANELLNRSLLNRSKFTVDTENVSSQLKQKYPELERVTFQIPLINRTPVITLTQSDPVFSIANQISGEYIIDIQGKALVKSSDNRSAAVLALPKIIDESNLKYESGKNILPSSSVKYIQMIIDQFKAKNISIQSLTLPAVPEELDVKVVGESYVIKFNILSDARISAGMYFVLRAKEPSRLNNIQYIDLRVEERAYIK
ncbi:MAG: hypothetical protein NVSMB46_09210 [Candidatus Saccharimonadales bacterium]